MTRKTSRKQAEPVERVPVGELGNEALTALLNGAAAWTPGEKLYGLKVGGRRGFVGASGELIIAPSPMGEDEHEVELFGFAEGLMILEVFGRRGILDIATREVIPPIFKDADLSGFSEGAWAVQHEGAWGFIDRDGRWLVAPRYSEVKKFSDGLAAVCERGKWGFVDRQGELVIRPRFNSAGQFGEGLCPCQEGEGYGFIDRDGAWVVEPRYRFAGEFAEGRGMIMVESLSGFVDASGSEVIAPRHKWATAFREGLSKTEDPRKPEKKKKAPDVFYETRYGYIDAAGDMVLELPAGDYPYIFTRGLAAVGRPGPDGGERRWGFVDRSGATAIPFEYEEACVFDEVGYAYVRTAEGWQVIDERGEYLARVVVEDGTARLLGRGGQLWP